MICSHSLFVFAFILSNLITYTLFNIHIHTVWSDDLHVLLYSIYSLKIWTLDGKLVFREEYNELHRLEWPASPSPPVTAPRLHYKPIHPQNLNDRFFVTAAPPKRGLTASGTASAAGATDGVQGSTAEAAAAARPATATGATQGPAPAQAGGGRYVPPHMRNATPNSALAACIPGLAPAPASAPSSASASSASPQHTGRKGGKNKSAAPASAAENVPSGAAAGGATMHADFQLPSHLRPAGSATGLSVQVQLLDNDSQPEQQTEDASQKKRYNKSKV